MALIMPEGMRAARRSCKKRMEELLDLAANNNSIDLRIALGTCTQDVVYAVKLGDRFMVDLTPAQLQFVENAARRKIVVKQLVGV
jgi:hypothetical protein